MLSGSGNVVIGMGVGGRQAGVDVGGGDGGSSSNIGNCRGFVYGSSIGGCGFVYGGNKGNGSGSGSGQGGDPNVSLRVVFTLISVRIFPIPLSGFILVGGRGVRHGEWNFNYLSTLGHNEREWYGGAGRWINNREKIYKYCALGHSHPRTITSIFLALSWPVVIILSGLWQARDCWSDAGVTYSLSGQRF